MSKTVYFCSHHSICKTRKFNIAVGEVAGKSLVSSLNDFQWPVCLFVCLSVCLVLSCLVFLSFFWFLGNLCFQTYCKLSIDLQNPLLSYFLLSLYFLSYLFTSLLVYFLTSSRIGPLHFQAGGHRKQPNLALVFWLFGYFYFVMDACLLLLCLC